YGYVADSSSEEEETYFFHSDHLGSTSYITDKDGNITQYDAFLPYGELLVDEHSSSEEMPYKFNGKELDEETGLYYYGARYMNPVASLFLNTDRFTEKYPHLSAYNYCAGNPISSIDVNGDTIIFTKECYEIPNYIDNFNKIITQLQHCGDKEVEEFINNIVKDSRPIYVTPTNLDAAGMGNDGTDGKPIEGYLYFDTEMYAKTNKEVIMSPGTILIHEFFHTLGDMNGLSAVNNVEDAQFGTKGDRDIIEVIKDETGKEIKIGIEQRAARALGDIKDNEVTRSSGGGLTYYKASQIIRNNETGKYELKE
ncbi:MAG: RHS repeat-associated core domain-containing protein, partial [Bacteroidaceae bacterium]|nr:RHS repeat-associated core domain-containing protein [Bacteroidaceae bacterium]